MAVFALSFTATAFLVPPPPEPSIDIARTDDPFGVLESTRVARYTPGEWNAPTSAAAEAERPESWGSAVLGAAQTVGHIAAEAIEPLSLPESEAPVVQAGMSLGFHVPDPLGDALGIDDLGHVEPDMTRYEPEHALGTPSAADSSGALPLPDFAPVTATDGSLIDDGGAWSTAAQMHAPAGSIAPATPTHPSSTRRENAGDGDLRVVRARFDGHDRLLRLDGGDIAVDTGALAVLARELSGGRNPMPGTTVEAVYELRDGGPHLAGLRVGYGIGARQAFYYESAAYGAKGFYSRDGRSLDGRLLRYPVTFRSVTSHFSYSRPHPILRRRKPHYGVDFAAPEGAPVVAVGAGKVRSAGWEAGGGGTTVHVEHGDGYVSGYAHLQRVASGIKRGAPVRKGQVIGYVGSTGLATGPHLHFSLSRNGSFLDPLGPSVPSHESLLGLALMEFRTTVVERSEAAWAFAADQRRKATDYASAPSRSTATR